MQDGLSMTWLLTPKTGPEVIKLFSYSSQLSTKFQLLIKTKIPTIERSFLLYTTFTNPTLKLVDYLHVQADNPWYNYYLILSDVVFIMLIKIKIELETSFITWRPEDGLSMTCLLTPKTGFLTMMPTS